MSKENARAEVGSLRVTPELFFVPHGSDYIVYAPLKRAAMLGNRGLVGWLQRFETDPVIRDGEEGLARDLLARGILEKAGEETEVPVTPEEPFAPTELHVLLTAVCNFSCRYCYAKGGERTDTASPEAVEAGARLVLDNCAALGRAESMVLFHGGGEPTNCFSLMKHCVQYARDYAGCACPDTRVTFGLATNGYLSETQVQWLGANMTAIQLSIDGPREIHDEQRPHMSGKGTFDRVFRSLAKLERMGVPEIYPFAAVTERSVEGMPETTRFFCENTGLPRFYLMPVKAAGRTLDTEYEQPRDLARFIEAFEEAEAIAESHGRKVIVSFAQETFPGVRMGHCRLNVPHMLISPEDRVTACFEGLFTDDTRAPLFHYGAFDREKGEFVFDEERIRRLQGRTLESLSYCADCFARWQCAGDCQARLFDQFTGQERRPEFDFKCELNRALVKRGLLQMLSGVDTGTEDTASPGAAGRFLHS